MRRGTLALIVAFLLGGGLTLSRVEARQRYSGRRPTPYMLFEDCAMAADGTVFAVEEHRRTCTDAKARLLQLEDSPMRAAVLQCWKFLEEALTEVEKAKPLIASPGSLKEANEHLQKKRNLVAEADRCIKDQPPRLEGSCVQFSNMTDEEVVLWKQWYKDFYDKVLKPAMMPVLDKYANQQQMPQEILIDFTVPRPSQDNSWPRTDTVRIDNIVVKSSDGSTAFKLAVKEQLQMLSAKCWPENSKRDSVQLHEIFRINYGKRGATPGQAPAPEIICR